MSKKWETPFQTGRQMTAYGALQEMTTFVIYKKQQKLAEVRGHKVLADVYKIIARDEMAHAQYYEMILQHYLDDDREGTLKDLGHVFYNFTMPAHDLLPDYQSRIEVMRTASYAGSTLPLAHFGLGPTRVVQRIEVRWPSGAKSVLTDIEADRLVRINEPKPEEHAAPQP